MRIIIFIYIFIITSLFFPSVMSASTQIPGLMDRFLLHKHTEVCLDHPLIEKDYLFIITLRSPWKHVASSIALTVTIVGEDSVKLHEHTDRITAIEPGHLFRSSYFTVPYAQRYTLCLTSSSPFTFFANSTLHEHKFHFKTDQILNVLHEFQQPVSTPDTLIVLTTFNAAYANQNLEFVCRVGFAPLAPRYYVVVLFNGTPNTQTRERLECMAKVLPNFLYIQIADGNSDFCSTRRLLTDFRMQSRMRYPLSQFTRFITLNGSIRGPFLRNSDDIHTWPEIFLGMLTESVALSGLTINCYGLQPGHDIHVQSMLFGFDRRFLPVYLNQTYPCSQKRLTKQETIDQFEVKMLKRCTEAGYNAAVMQRVWYRNDFRNETSTDLICRTKAPGDILLPKYNMGWKFHPDPLEFVFFKTNRGIPEDQITKLTEWTYSTLPTPEPCP